MLGGGFGLYGWLPAAAMVPAGTAQTLARYERAFAARPELAHLTDRIRFVHDSNELIEESDCLIIARRPGDQPAVVEDLVRRRWRGSLVLEKPLASTPACASAMLDRLSGTDIRLASGFVMDRTEWGAGLIELLRERPDRLDISWRFHAHHYRHALDSWKRRPASGGGALRFFAIHLVALFAQCGDWTVVACSGLERENEDSAVSFVVRLGATEARVTCNSRWTGKPGFDVTASRAGQTIWVRRLGDPFGDPAGSRIDQRATADRRISYLACVLRDVAATGGAAPDLTRHVSLWNDLEAARTGS